MRSGCSLRFVRHAPRVSRFARPASARLATSAAARRGRSGSAVKPAARTFPSRRAPCSPTTSCRCKSISRPPPLCNEVKGQNALAVSRELGVQDKTAFVLAHKIRAALATEMKGWRLGGEGKDVEIDAGYFGGYVKPANRRENRRDLRLVRNQTGKRQAVIVIRERDGYTLPGAFPSETAALSFIRSRVAKGTEISADDLSGWDTLAAMIRNEEDQPPARLQPGWRDDELGRIILLADASGRDRTSSPPAGTDLARYAQESAWRENHHRDPNGFQVRLATGLALKARPSVDFCGYWQRSRQA